MDSATGVDDGPAATAAKPRPGSEPEDAAPPGPNRGPTLSKEKTRLLGNEIYEREIRPLVEDAHDGEYVAIDVSGGGWAVSGDLLTAAALLRAEYPEAVDVWLLRVGYRAVFGFGGQPLRSAS